MKVFIIPIVAKISILIVQENLNLDDNFRCITMRAQILRFAYLVSVLIGLTTTNLPV